MRERKRSIGYPSIKALIPFPFVLSLEIVFERARLIDSDSEPQGRHRRPKLSSDGREQLQATLQRRSSSAHAEFPYR